MEADKVNLCRRKSGGGAVYQDLGNTCFSFINPKSSQDYKNINNSIVLRALNVLDIEAETSGRNDIIVEGKKVSGSAYKLQLLGSNLHTTHHGTMLINTDTSAIVKYLNPNKAKLESKGIKSVSSRVANLVDFNPQVTHEDFVNSIIKSYSKEYPDAEVVYLLGIPPIAQENAKKMQDWNWVYGESSKFSHQLETRFKWGVFDMNLEVNEGIITRCKIYSDCLYPDFIDFVEKNVISKKYGQETVDSLKKNSNKEYVEMIEELTEWFLSAI